MEFRYLEISSFTRKIAYRAKYIEHYGRLAEDLIPLDICTYREEELTCRKRGVRLDDQ
jgi:hypothetical protein